MNHIVLYTQPSCYPCKAAADSLERQGIPFEKVDVTVDPEAAERLRRNGFQSTPVIGFAGELHALDALPTITRQILNERTS